jgi:hypothetical protein
MARIKLLEVNKEGEVVISDECRLIEPFSTMLTLAYNRQKGDTQGRDRVRATKEFKYIYFMFDWASSHEGMDVDERHEESLKSAGLPKNYKFSDEMTAACLKFKKLRHSRPVRQLVTARQSLDRIRKFLDTVDPNEQVEYTDTNGNTETKPRYDTKEALDIAKMVQDHVKNLPDMIKKMNDLEAQVMKDESEETTARGEHALGRLG